MKHISQIHVDSNSYSNQLKDARWIVLARRVQFAHPFCNSCKRGDVVLQVHHRNYDGRKAWEYQDNELVVLCKPCHELIHKSIKAFRDAVSFRNATSVAAATGLLIRILDRNADAAALEKLASISK